jgi:hypothetical protein
MIRLRMIVARFGLSAVLEDTFAAVAEGRSTIAIAYLKRLDAALAEEPAPSPAALQARGSIIVISEVLAQHAEYFDVGDEK